MKTRDEALKEKERAEKLKALRRELEAELETQLAGEFLPEREGLAGRTHVEVHGAAEGAPLEAARATQIIEALLFASSKPLTVAEIKKVLKGVSVKEIEASIQELKQSYIDSGRSFEVLEIAGGFEIASKKEFAPWILRVELQKKIKQATQSALETLAILAYKQPITRAEIEELRGVDVSAVLTTLVERGLIKIVGKKEVPGRPFLYGTTEKFLEHFGLKSIQDLPNIEEIKNMVENSVRKDELLGKTQMVPVPAEEAAPAAQAPVETPEEEEDEEGEEALGSDRIA